MSKLLSAAVSRCLGSADLDRFGLGITGGNALNYGLKNDLPRVCQEAGDFEMIALEKTLFSMLMLFAMFTTNAVGQESLSDRDWTEFRGPNSDGHSKAINLPAEFGEGKNMKWKIELPGRGWSSPVLMDNEIWLTTAMEVKATGEELERKMTKADIQGMSAYARVELQAIRINRDTGKIEATVDLFTIDDPPLIHSLNSFASPTPTIDRNNAYFHFGTFGTAAVNRKTGKIAWKTRDYPLDHETGPGSSPILFHGLLIVHCDGCDVQYVVALDSETGKEVWKTDRSGEMHDNPMFKKSFSTPIIIRRGNTEQLVSAAANWVYGYDPLTGRELWKLSYGQLGFSNVSRPIFKDGMLFVCTCFGQSKMMAIDCSGEDPVTDDDVKWTFQKQIPNMPSPVEIDGAIYLVSDRGIVTCLDAKSGDVNWQGRLSGGFSSSPLFADGKIYFGNQEGEVFVLSANSSNMELLASNQLDSQIMASPAAVGTSLFIRTSDSLYCFENVD